ncbi:MAG: S9 family peptidase [Phycisphaerales bacterium JB037]
MRPQRANPARLRHRALAHAAVFALAALALCAPPAPAAAATRAGPPELIPRETFFGSPTRSRVRLSPDGRSFAFVAPFEGVANLWTAPVDHPEKVTPATREPAPGVITYAWSASGEHLVYLVDPDTNENWQARSVELATGTVLDLTPRGSGQAKLADLDPSHPHSVLIALNDRDPELHDLYEVDLNTAKRTLRRIAPRDAAGWIIAPGRELIYSIRLTTEGGATILLTHPDRPAQPILDIGREDLLTTGVKAITTDRRWMILEDSRGRDTAALARLPLDDRGVPAGPREILAQDDASDIADVLLDPRTNEPVAVAFERARLRWHPLCEDAARDLARLESAHDGAVRITSQSDDASRWLAVLIDDDGPARYRVLDRESPSQSADLGATRPELETLDLRPMESVTIPTRDGLELVGYLTRPDSPDAAPLVLLVHGGPWARDHWGYDPFHQLLANRGMAVLSVNYRGSTGFGKAFVNAGNLEWGGAMQTDLVDAARWAIAEGIADPDRLAIMGGSYGGYAALSGLAFTPDLFACGVAVAAPADLVSMLRTIPPYWEPLTALWRDRVGDVESPEGRDRLRERSPLAHADRIIRPTLILHGERDPRAHVTDVRKLADAVGARGVPVSLGVFPDEAHGIRRPENWLAVAALTEVFLARHLGVRAQRLDGVVEDSSIRLETGSSLLDPPAPAPPPGG